MSNRYLKGSLLATTVIAGMAFTAPAYAQTAQDPAAVPATPEPGVPGTPAPASSSTPAAGIQTPETTGPSEQNSQGDIVVTGTLIKNPNLVSSAPVTVVGQDEIQLRQTNTAEQVLRDLPGAVASVGSAVNNGNGGASFVDLRGLGPNRNVVLLDGVRIAPSGLGGIVDLNNIPLALVDRIDVLTGGASTTYGADAISGVVNFVTRKDFSGMELEASQQLTQQGDGKYFRGDLTIGANFDDNRGNAVLSVGYQKSDPVYQGSRDFSRTYLESYQAECIPCQGSSTTVPAVFSLGTRNRQLNTTTGALGSIFSRFNFNPFNIFQTPFKRYNLYAAGHYQVADAVEVYARGLFSDNTVSTIIAPSGVFGVAVNIPYSNPYLPLAARNQFCTVNGLTADQCAAAAAATDPSDPNYKTFRTSLRRRTPELGPRESDFNTKIFDFRAGVRGKITDSINWDVFGAYGRSTNTQDIQHYAIFSRVQQALLATNTTDCITATNGCVPLNVFGPEGSITPEQAAFVSQEATSNVQTSLGQARALINGDVGFQLPWAANPIGFAVGGEYRKYKASQNADVLAQSPTELGGSGGATVPFRGGYQVTEGFAEIIAPLIQDRPFFHDLTVEAGVRRSHYSVDAPNHPKFNTTTYKAGGTFSPVSDFKIRGDYQRAVRAPNIGELFGPVSTGLTNLTSDPCSGSAPVNNANLAAVCLAQGAPTASLGGIQNPTGGQANITGGGNPNLRPEKARTITIGAVFQPSFLHGFSATLDYYKIKVTDAITSPTPGDLINACFGATPTAPPASAATNPACTIIQRNPITGALEGDPGSTPGLFGVLSNLGTLKTNGFDLTLNYRRGLGEVFGAPARINLSFQGNYTRSSKFQATPTSVDRECVGFYSINCASIQPKYSFNQRTTLSLGIVDFSVLWRYIHSVKLEPSQLQADQAAAGAANVDETGAPLAIDDQGCPDFNGADPGGCIIDPQFRRIKSYHYFDFSTRFNVSRNFEMTVTVMNLLNKKPPIVGADIGSTSFNSGNTYPSTYDALGRRFAVSARLKF